MATPDLAPLPRPMPDDLKARGWKMARVDGGLFKAKNDSLGLYSNPMSSPEDAIDEARRLDQGETMSFDGSHTAFTAPIATEEEVPVELGEKREPVPASNNSFVPVEKIRLDGGTQPRAEIDQSVVDRYAEDYTDGVVLPPIVLFFDGINHWLGDGFHRYFAFRKAFPNSGFMGSDVRPGTQRDAVLFSLGANATHGLPRSNSDKRRAALTMLEDPEWSRWSDNVIAGKLNVSQPFVSSLRRELSQNVLSEPRHVALSLEELHDSIGMEEEPAPAPPQPAKRIGRDGVARDTSRIGRVARDVSQAQTDIQVDADKPATAKAAPVPEGPDGWSEQALNLHIQINAGKSTKRSMLVSGRHGDARPLFLQATAAELEPMPPALAALIGNLQKDFRKRSSRQTPTTTKSKAKKPAKKK